MSTTTKTIEDYYKEAQKQTSQNTENKVTAINNAAAASNKIIKENYAAQTQNTENQYNSLLDQNNVQKLINERKIAENMSNLGLTDSGLSRTQITANQLSAANNQSKIQRERQNAVDTLARAMNAELTEVETNRALQESNIRTAAEDSNYNTAVNLYNAEQERISNEKIAREKAEAEKIQQQNKDYQAVLNAMGNKNNSADTKASWMLWYGNLYGVSSTDLVKMFGDPYVQAQQEAAAAQNTSNNEDTSKKITARNSLINTLSNSSLSTNAKIAYFNNYVEQYGYDETDALLEPLLKENGIVLNTNTNTNTTNNNITNNNVKAPVVQKWTTSDVDTLSKMYYSHGVTNAAWLNYFANYAANKGYNDTEAVALFNAVTSSGAKRGSINPMELKYTVISKPKSYKGDIANTAKVVDEFGVERTIENVYYNTKVYYAMKEYGADKVYAAMESQNNTLLNTYLNDDSVKSQAKKDVKALQKQLGITK